MINTIAPLNNLGILQSTRSAVGSKQADRGFGNIFAGSVEKLRDGEKLDKKESTQLAEIIHLEMLSNSLSLAFAEKREYAPGDIVDTVKLLLEGQRLTQSDAPEHGSQAVSAPVAELQTAGGPDTSEFDNLINRAARRFGVDGGLIKAVIKAESNFNPNAVSSAGAEGLMQLMPATARGLGVANSFDPEQNVMAGTKFLKSLLDKYGGDIDAVLAAYNWGPGNVDRGRGLLPRETRNYLSRVKTYYDRYSA